MASDSLSVPLFAVVVPMYNERVGAEACIHAVLSELTKLTISATLIVVDDGSRDGTGPLLDQLQMDIGGFQLIHQANTGYGGALVTGGRAAADLGIPYVLFMDSDLTNPPSHIERFITPMTEGWDVIKGCRFSPGGSLAGVPWQRQIFSRLGNVVARMLFRVGIADCTNGFRAIRTELFMRMNLTERSFPVIVEELYWAKKLGATITSVPTILHTRSADQRPTLFSYKWDTIRRYLGYSLRAALCRGRTR